MGEGVLEKYFLNLKKLGFRRVFEGRKGISGMTQKCRTMINITPSLRKIGNLFHRMKNSIPLENLKLYLIFRFDARLQYYTTVNLNHIMNEKMST